MKKQLASLLILLAFTVYFKPIAAYTGGIMTGLKEPKKIELKEINPPQFTFSGSHILVGKDKEGKLVIIPWDSISYIEESKN